MFLFISCKERKHGDGQLDRKDVIAPQAFERFLDGHVTNDRQVLASQKWTPKTKSVTCWYGPRRWRKTEQKSGTSVSRFTGNKRKLECHTGGRPRKAFFHSVITWQLECLWLQVTSAKTREKERPTSFLSVEQMCFTTYTFKRVKAVFEELFCSLEGSIASRYYSLCRTFIIEDGSEERICILGNRCSNWRTGLCWR